jgi:predicted signal transduction protein with EAL and GGDEF domain
VQYAIELAAVLGIEVVAEGIETPTELQKLRALGCPLGQGFLFSRAVPGDEMLGLLTRDARDGGAWWTGEAPHTPRRRRDSDAAVTADGR